HAKVLAEAQIAKTLFQPGPCKLVGREFAKWRGAREHRGHAKLKLSDNISEGYRLPNMSVDFLRQTLMQQAAEMEFPVRRAWMALQCHMMPRMLRTCASLSDGCSHAATFLIALTASAVNKMELTGVIPR
ncbi:unnamed protein product, partial [Prorocentrum cordatum]